MKRIFQKATPLIALALLVSFTPTRVEAAPIALAPGGSTSMSAAQDQVAASPGTLLAQLTSPFTINGTQIVGSVIAAVYQSASGFLNFYYQVSNSTASGGPGTSLSAINGANFASSTTSVAYYSNAGAFGGVFAAPSSNTKPLSARRSTNGAIVNFLFGPPFGPNMVGPGQTSSIMMIATNGRNWGLGTSTVQNGSPTSSATVTAFQVPEPASAGLALLGFAIMAGVRRRLQKK